MPLRRLKELNTTDCLWIYILRILRDDPSHAYTIRQEIKSRYGFLPGIMTAYKVLYLLHRKGYVSRKVRGRRRVYSLTPRGKRELEKAREFYKQMASTLA